MSREIKNHNLNIARVIPARNFLAGWNPMLFYMARQYIFDMLRT